MILVNKFLVSVKYAFEFYRRGKYELIISDYRYVGHGLSHTKYCGSGSPIGTVVGMDFTRYFVQGAACSVYFYLGEKRNGINVFNFIYEKWQSYGMPYATYENILRVYKFYYENDTCANASRAAYKNARGNAEI